jgi:hypothetical protein
MRTDIDWKYLLRTAYRHGVAPLLYWHLDAICPEAIPKSVLDQLREHFHANNQRNLFLTGELLRLLNEFEAYGIVAIPYKGPALSASVYGNLALREFYDLDILVHRSDVSKAKEVLTSMGYHARYQLTRAQETAFLQSQFEHPFTRDDGKSIVELHWEITERHFLPFDTERLWERLNQIRLGGDVVLNLSPEDMLLILCVHGAKHGWERLGWICDVAELVRCQDIRWERVIAQASAVGSKRMLLFGLSLANDLLGVALPEKISYMIRADPTLKTLVEQTSKQLFHETHCPTGFLEGYGGAPAFHTVHLAMRESLRDKIRYFTRKVTILTGEDWVLLPLPKFLFPLYWVLRAIRLTRKYGPRIFKRTFCKRKD